MTKAQQRRYESAKREAEAWDRAANRACTIYDDPALKAKFEAYAAAEREKMAQIIGQ